ncbi:ribulose-phosphate 3-epimerase [Propioniciclava flava]|uniref:Ribulose-phosphate 3-epimerase n=1 Tax=Propioniciclava flava TaxID=2072026 RepID=A0A4Q2EL45_9ACTN|nr:ribulose-phosphate 3-epimerase [Propioniciclava flava]RXW33506.1 ribulose-phosphate 3-epimerase [Propioniciclava flava]
MPHRIHPSILNANLASLDDEIRRIPSADGIHLDVMDNHFVPNLTIGLPVVESIRANHPDRFLDVHLMITDADRYAPGYAEIGCESVTFHLEASAAPIRTARTIRGLGAKASLGLRPQTPIEPLADIITEFDMVLIMTVDPGFGGQSFLTEMLPKIRRTREIVERSGADIWIQVDGGVSESTIDQCLDAGATVFVAGSAVFRAEDPDAVVRGLRERPEVPCRH